MNYDLQSLQAWIQSLYSPGTYGVNQKGNPTGVIASYSYPLTITALVSATSQTSQLTMQANADFVCLDVSYHANIANAAQNVGNKTVALARMLVTDTGSNMQWSQAAMDLENYATNDAKFRPLKWPRFVQGRSALTIQTTNYDAAVTYNIELAFNGVLVYLY